MLVDDGGGHGVERLPAIEPLAATTSLSRTAHLHPPVGVDGVVFGGGERGVVPAMLTVDEHNVAGLHRFEPLVDRGRRGGTAELHHDIGTELLTDRVLEQVFGRGDDDVVVQPHTAHRFPDDGPGQCPGEFSDMFGKAVPGVMPATASGPTRITPRSYPPSSPRRSVVGALANDNRSSGVGYSRTGTPSTGSRACEAAS